MSIQITHPSSVLCGEIKLPLSKSESNRILILQALSNGKIGIENISDARDTKLLQEALGSDTLEINVQDAGTAMRFLLAYYCATNQHKILKGSERMCERPIGILVDALREIGFTIKYLGANGFPPLEILPSDLSKLNEEVSIKGNVSSQYISALMMIAPVLPKGLTIRFTTTLSSKPYVQLTRKTLANACISAVLDDTVAVVAHQPFRSITLSAGADWSAASYWYSMAVLSKKVELLLSNLPIDSYQGDKKIVEWCEELGIQSHETAKGVLLCNIFPTAHIYPGIHFDFTHYPDLAQTIVVLCAAKGINATFTGMQSLRIKETDRIVALQIELQKFGVNLVETAENVFQLAGTFIMSYQTIFTYNDHRMAMAFAPLAVLGKITIEHPGVVEKSYPDFWKEMEKIGFKITLDTPPQS